MAAVIKTGLRGFQIVPALVGALAIVSLPLSASARGADLPAGLQQRIKPLIQKLKQQGLPHALLIDKAREGVAKKVPVPRIVRALRLLAGHLEEGLKTLKRGWRWPGRRIPASLVRAYAEARFSGVAAAPAARVLRTAGLPARWRLARTGLDVLADLAVAGYRPDVTVDLVVRLARKRSIAQVARLKGTLTTLTRRYGLSRTAAARTLSKALDTYRGNLKAATIHLHKVHKSKTAKTKTGK
jgi:hypothetical protein